MNRRLILISLVLMQAPGVAAQERDALELVPAPSQVVRKKGSCVLGTQIVAAREARPARP